MQALMVAFLGKQRSGTSTASTSEVCNKLRIACIAWLLSSSASAVNQPHVSTALEIEASVIITVLTSRLS